MKKNYLILIAVLSLFCFSFAIAESQSSLPAFTYTGDDPVLAAVSAETANYGSSFLLEDNSVSIPVPIVLKTETVDDTHMKVYGNFWVFNYTLKDDVLDQISGGERPAIMSLEKKDEGWIITNVEECDSGADYYLDIKRFCNGDKELEEAFATSADASSPLFKEVFLKYLQDYITANNLPAKFWKEYGTELMPIFQ